MNISPLLLQFAISVALGLVVGLQRERTEDSMAGVRTFALITLLGCVLATLDQTGDGWLLSGIGLFLLAAMMVIGNLARWRLGDVSPGMTTEVAALLMFCAGALVAVEQTAAAIVMSGTVAVLLHWKERIHSLVDRIGEIEAHGIFQLVLIALVILPLLPDATFGPYDILNPYDIWRMVVLIAGISLMAYLIHRLIGATSGAVIGGVLGGLISSTATTVSYSRHATRETAWPSTLVLIIASTIVNARVLFEIFVVNRPLFEEALWPIVSVSGVMVLLCAVALVMSRRQAEGVEIDYDNPAQLKAAVIFGLLYAVILLIVAAVRDTFGEAALYPVAIVSGLTDVDAITLSTARLHADGNVSADTSWRVIITAMSSNLAFKAGVVGVLGNRHLLRRTGALFAVSIAASLAVILFWPSAG